MCPAIVPEARAPPWQEGSPQIEASSDWDPLTSFFLGAELERHCDIGVEAGGWQDVAEGSSFNQTAKGA